MKHKGMLISNDPEGKTHVTEIDLPIETYASALGWGMDMCRAMMHFSKFRKYLLKLIMGKYAFRELIGLRDCIEQYGYTCSNPDIGYCLENMEYHKDKVKL